jgi:hypothetical protein
MQRIARGGEMRREILARSAKVMKNVDIASATKSAASRCRLAGPMRVELSRLPNFRRIHCS